MKIQKHVKEKIEKAVFNKKIKPLQEALKLKVEEQVKAYILDQTKEHQKFIKSAPVGWLYKCDSFTIAFSESYEDRFYVKLQEPQVTPFSWYKNYRDLFLNIIDKEWKTVFSNLKKEEIIIKKYETELMSELKGFLSGVNTDKQLLDLFPEISEYINLNDYNFHAPVVQPEKLKRLLAEV